VSDEDVKSDIAQESTQVTTESETDSTANLQPSTQTGEGEAATLKEGEQLIEDVELDEEKKKSIRYILNLSGDIRQDVFDYFSSLGLKVIHDVSEENVKISFICIKNHQGSYSKIDEMYQTLAKDISIISLSDVANKEDFLRYNGKLILNPWFMTKDLSRNVLKRLVDEKTSLHLDEAFGDKIKDVKTAKVINHLRVGFYSDLIAADAFEKDFNIIGIRNYFLSLISYLMYLKKSGIGELPIEVEYGRGASEFLIQMHISVKDFVTEYIWGSFESENPSDPTKFLLNTCSNLAPLFDVYYLEKSEKIVFTAIWPKNDQMENITFNSMGIGNLTSATQMDALANAKISNISLAIEENNMAIEEELKEKKLPGGIIDVISVAGKGDVFAKDPASLKNIINHIQNKYEEGEFDPTKLKDYLADFGDPGLIESLSLGDFSMITDAMAKEGFAEEIAEAVEEKREEVEADEQLKELAKIDIEESMADRLTKALTEKLDEGEEGAPSQARRSSLFGGDEDEAIVVAGSPAYLNEEKRVVKDNLAKKAKKALSAKSVADLLKNKTKDQAKKDLASEMLDELGLNPEDMGEEEREAFENEVEEYITLVEGGEASEEDITNVQERLSESLVDKVTAGKKSAKKLKNNKKLREQVKKGLTPEEVQKIEGDANALANEKNVVGGKFDEDDSAQKVNGSKDDGDDATRVKGSRDQDDDSAQKVNGSKDDGDDATRVKGSRDQDDEGSTKVAGGFAENEDDAQRVKGGPSDNGDDSQRIKGGPNDNGDDSQRIKGGPNDNRDDAQRIKGKGVDGEMIHRILGDEMEKMKDKGWSLKEMGSHLSEKVASELGVKVADIAPLVDEAINLSKDKVVSEQFNENVLGVIENNEDKVLKIKMMKELQTKEKQIKHLQNKLNAAKIEVATNRETKKAIDDSTNKMNEELDESETQREDSEKTIEQLTSDETINELENSEKILEDSSDVIEKLQAGKVLTDFEVENLKRLAEEGRHSTLTATSAVNELKRLKSANDAQSNFLKREIEGAKRLVKARELMLVKTKEGVSTILERKEKQMQTLRSRIDHLARQNKMSKNTGSDDVVNKVKTQRDAYGKQVDVLKRKVANLTGMLSKTKSAAGSSGADLKMEKELQRAKNERKNTLVALSAVNKEKTDLEKMVKALEFKLRRSSGNEAINAGELADSGLADKALEAQLSDKDQSGEAKKLKSQVAELEKKLKASESGNPISEREVDPIEGNLKKENSLLQSKIKLLQKQLGQAGDAPAAGVVAKTVKAGGNSEAAVNALEGENSSLEGELKSAQAELRLLKETSQGDQTNLNSVLAKEKAALQKESEKSTSLLQEKLEAVGKLQESEGKLKVFSREIKKLEHKLKLATQKSEKLEKLAKKSSGGSGAGAKEGAMDPRIKHQLKQLEMKKEQAEKNFRKTSMELVDAKKHMAKFKSEQTAMKNKMAALEREVAKHKKAA
jgi:hypothetical protein